MSGAIVSLFDFDFNSFWDAIRLKLWLFSLKRVVFSKMLTRIVRWFPHDVR